MEAKRHLNAAIGYINLGMASDALAELDAIDPSRAQAAEVLAVRAAACIQLKQWQEALAIASLLMQQIPGHIAPYLDAAFCLHELGLTEQARDCLLNGPESLRQSGTFHYNMACYEAHLGNYALSRRFLAQAIKMDSSYLELARKDPDLDPLRLSGELETN